MKARVAILIFAALGCGSARADWAYTHWGMTPEQVAAKSSGDVKVLPPAERTKDEEDHWEIAASGIFKDGSRVLETGFMFDDKTGLRCVIYGAHGPDADAVKAGLIKKYGPGKEGTGFVHTITWNNPDEIEISIDDKHASAVVTHCRPGG